jgi:LacI family transcriptional regulator
MKDIANELGLSISTVSRALQDNPAIAEETIIRVKEIAQKLDYFPDSIARNLKTNASATIGVIVPEIKHEFFSSVIDGMEDLAHQHGFTVIVSKSNEDYDREVLNTHHMLSNRVAGIAASISQSTQDGDHFLRFLNRGIPVVLFDRVLDDLDVSKVIVNDYQGSIEAIQHLIDRGYKRIAHLAGPSPLGIARERQRGYKDALVSANIPYDEDLVIHGAMGENAGKLGVISLFDLEEPPDAIFAVNDPVAIGARGELLRMGLNIPDDVGLLGFSNNRITEKLDPPLTTVDQHGYKMGQVAVQILLDELKTAPDKRKSVTKVIETELIVRESTNRQGG